MIACLRTDTSNAVTIADLTEATASPFRLLTHPVLNTKRRLFLQVYPQGKMSQYLEKVPVGTYVPFKGPKVGTELRLADAFFPPLSSLVIGAHYISVTADAVRSMVTKQCDSRALETSIADRTKVETR